ncbi:MAG: ATP-dependent helicase HrpB [Planctomycetota bacterium]
MSRRPAPLPVDDVLDEVVAALRERRGAALVAPPGAGKTTRVPPALERAGLGPVIVVEPRRIAARAAARRVAEETGATLGQEVGWHVRFDRRAGRDTRILFATEGILLRRLQDDPFLEGVGALVFDEFHERRLDADLALAMARRAQREVRPDLALLVCSATLEAEPVARFLGDTTPAPTVRSEGRLFPVETRHLAPEPRERLEDHVARAIRLALAAPPAGPGAETLGDVLVFLPGVGEIRRVRERLASGAGAAEVHELYGDLDPARQDAALRRGPRRRVVLATNVAESSVTVDGVSIVIDAGLARVLRHDPTVGLDRLTLERIDRASADQRTGRAGRQGPGTCIRLWSQVDDRTLEPRTAPEVQRLDLAGPLLQLAAWGEPDAEAFPWFEAPGREAIARARQLLERLGALGRASTPGGGGRAVLTPLGQALAALPIHPRLGRLLVEGARLGAGDRAALAAALLADRDPFGRERGARASDAWDSDVLERVRALEAFERSGRTQFPIGDLRAGAAHQILKARDQLLRVESDVGDRGCAPRRRGAGGEAPLLEGADGLLRALLAAFPDRLCRRREDPTRGVMVGGRGVRLAPTSGVTEGELFLALEVDGGQGEALVRQASHVEREWVAGGRTHIEVEPVFDPRTTRVIGRRRELLGALVMSEQDHPLNDPVATERVLVEAAQLEPRRALGAEEGDLADVLARLACLAEWSPELALPKVDDTFLAQLVPLVAPGCRSYADLAKAPTIDVLLGLLTREQRAALERDAPERIQVPTGNRLRVQYEPGRAPVLAVRIQELFGLATTPTVARGRVPVVLHLLAPNGRPQQVTTDLASFWRDAYHVVRKDLRVRYPKHSWPEDPMHAPPQAKPRRRSN